MEDVYCVERGVVASSWSMMTGWVETLVRATLVAALFLLVVVYLQNRHRYWTARGVPSSPPTFFLGHILHRLGLSQPFTQFFEEVYFKYNGRDVCGYYDFLKPGLVVGNPDILKDILIKDFQHFADRRTFDLAKVSPVANDMLTNARGAHWRMLRGIVSPAFTATKTRRFYALLYTRAQHLLTVARSTATRAPVEARQLCGKYTMDTIASCAFGIECESLTKEAAIFPTMATRIFQLSPVRALKVIILLMAPRVAEVAHSLGLQFTSSEFEFFRQVATHTITRRQETGQRRGDFLDMLMDTKIKGETSLSNDTMAAQSILFLLAGYENTANTLAMALHLLSHHPHVQATLRREVALALLQSDGQVDHDRLMTLPYLDAVVSEVLRLYPAAPIIERICTKEYKMGGREVAVDPGMSILVPVWCLHRDDQYWPHPQHFQPERFLGDARAQIVPYTYLPFGVGPRSCIGKKFAILGVKAGLLLLISGLEVQPCPLSPYPLALDPRVLTLQPKDGVYVNLYPVDLKETVHKEMMQYHASTPEDEIIMEDLKRWYSQEDGTCQQ